MHETCALMRVRRKEVIEMIEDETPRLHAEILSAVSKAGKPYECIEVRLGDLPIGRIFPTELEMITIKNALAE